MCIYKYSMGISLGVLHECVSHKVSQKFMCGWGQHKGKSNNSVPIEYWLVLIALCLNPSLEFTKIFWLKTLIKSFTFKFFLVSKNAIRPWRVHHCTLLHTLDLRVLTFSYPSSREKTDPKTHEFWKQKNNEK